MADVRDQLRQYDAGFTTEKPEGAGFVRRPGVETLADGDYLLRVVEADLDVAAGKPLLRLILRAQDGRIVEYPFWLTSQVGCNIVGAMLVTCGVDADRWQATGRKFSDCLPVAVPALTGLMLKCHKKTEVGKDGVSRARLYVNECLGQNAETPPMPAQSDDWLDGGPGSSDEAVPF